jgi:hypothetical protein
LSSIGIHGTNEPELLGGEASHGCIRLGNETLVEIDARGYFRKGTAVYIAPYAFSGTGIVPKDTLIAKNTEKIPAVKWEKL